LLWSAPPGSPSEWNNFDILRHKAQRKANACISDVRSIYIRTSDIRSEIPEEMCSRVFTTDNNGGVGLEFDVAQRIRNGRRRTVDVHQMRKEGGHEDLVDS